MANQNFYLFTGLFSLGYSLYAGLRYYSVSGEGLITSAKARDMLRKKQINHVIDVRTRLEYNRGHYKKSINIPITELSKEKLKNINKRATILIYCNTGQRARRAGEKMRNMGYKNVYYIDGTHRNLL